MIAVQARRVPAAQARVLAKAITMTVATAVMAVAEEEIK
jgi:hypothetical protein